MPRWIRRYRFCPEKNRQRNDMSMLSCIPFCAQGKKPRKYRLPTAKNGLLCAIRFPTGWQITLRRIFPKASGKNYLPSRMNLRPSAFSLLPNTLVKRFLKRYLHPFPLCGLDRFLRIVFFATAEELPKVRHSKKGR